MGEGADREISGRPPAIAVIPILWRAQEQSAAGCRRRRSRPPPNCSAWRRSACSKSRPSTPCSIWRRSGAPRAALRHHAVHAARRRRDLKQSAQKQIGRRERTVTADGTFSWVEVECLGACVNAPMVQIKARLLRGPDAGRLDAHPQRLRGRGRRRRRSTAGSAHDRRADHVASRSGGRDHARAAINEQGRG